MDPLGPFDCGFRAWIKLIFLLSTDDLLFWDLGSLMAGSLPGLFVLFLKPFHFYLFSFDVLAFILLLGEISSGNAIVVGVK